MYAQYMVIYYNDTITFALSIPTMVDAYVSLLAGGRATTAPGTPLYCSRKNRAIPGISP